MYRGTCRKCRLVSSLVVIATGGGIRRVAAESPQAKLLFKENHPPAKVALWLDGEVWVGRSAVTALLRHLYSSRPGARSHRARRLEAKLFNGPVGDARTRRVD